MADLFQTTTEKIKDIKNKQSIKFYAKIDSFAVLTASNQKEYLNLNLLDETGSINAKKWDVKEEDKEFKKGSLVYIEGVGSEYQGKNQLIIHNIRFVNEFDGIDESLFYPQAPLDVAALKAVIYGYIDRIHNLHLSVITRTLIGRYEEQFFVYPAATSNHHAFISGLAYHVKTMLELGDAYLNLYPNLNKDLLYAGIILHDLGKIIELSDHLSPEYTVEGSLLGHINLCFELIKGVADEKGFKSEEVMLLQHLVLSHHGHLEYGSPKEPMVLEAEVLHLLDLADSRINMISDQLKEVTPGSFTKRMYALDGKSYYKHHLNDK